MNRIRELRERKNINMKEAARDLQIPYTTYVNYEKGEREPNSEMLITLANYFNVTIDYLLGRENILDTAYEPQQEKKVNLTQMTAQEILDYAEKKNETTYDILGYNGRSSKRTKLTKEEYDKVMEIIELMRKNSD